jgi:hypothetical protein
MTDAKTEKKNEFKESSVEIFIARLNELFENETFDYSFYDFEREEMKEKNKIYSIIENIKHDNSVMKYFCDTINKQLVRYEITSITNIICGKTYKHPNRRHGAILMSNGYYYCFTVICKRKGLKEINK